MISLTVARKYARALLALGKEEGKLEGLGGELHNFKDLIRENKELRGVLTSPFYPAETRKGMIRAIASSLSLSKTVQDFLNLLIERDRIDHFFEIVNYYDMLCDDYFKRIRATLVSSAELQEDLVNEIRDELQSTIGKEVILSVEQDPSLLGGVLTKIGNVVYDGSLKTQILRVRDNLYKE